MYAIILRLILEYKEPEEDWLSVKSKKKTITQGQQPSSWASGEGMSGGGREEESKSCKKAKLAVPCVALLSSTNRTTESDLMRSKCNEG